jgi:ABC-type transport system involved in multi-copper enzyme maturation permease subunit
MHMASLRSISPFGPIFGKELRTTARRKRTYLLRVLYLGSLMLFLLLAYSTVGIRSYGAMGVAARQQQQAQLGQIFFAMFAMFGVFAMGMIGPVLTCTAVGSERVGRTLNVLLMTPITSWQIISGKLLSRLWIALTLLGLSLPVLALVRLLGSVELNQMFAVICLCVVTALVTAAIGLFFSTLMNRAYAVIMLSYATQLLLYAFGPMIAGMLLADSIGPGQQKQFLGLFMASNPFAQTALMMTPSGLFMQSPHQWLWCVAVQAALAALLVLCSAAMLRGRSRRDGGRAHAAQEILPMPPAIAIAAPASAGALPPPLPGAMEPFSALPAGKAPRKARPARTVSDNPVLWHEVRRPLMARRWQGVVGALATVGLLLLTYAAIARSDHLSDPSNQTAFAFIFCGMVTLLTCVLSATAIAQEKESDTWSLLLTTPLPAHAIVLGKLFGVMRRLLWPMLLITGHFVLFMLMGVLPPATVLVLLWIIVSFNSVWLATGLYLSLRLKKVTFEVILNMLLPLGAYMMVPMILAILQQTLTSGTRPDLFMEWGLIYQPYVYLAYAIEHVQHTHATLWLPVWQEASAAEFFMAVLTIGSALLLISVLMLCGLILRFNRIVKRAAQDDLEQAGPILPPQITTL